QVIDLSPLQGLTALQSLNCGYTQVIDLSPLQGLTALQSLSCWRTQVIDLSPLQGLTALQSLNCSGCAISTIPDSLFEGQNWREVYFFNCAVIGIGKENLSQSVGDNCLLRLRAHFQDLQHGSERMREAKMLVLGNGRVGKTQLVRGLFDEPFDDNVVSTHGIDVRPYRLSDPTDGEQATIWIWDFGGQDIYHSTHTLFMRSRGFYLAAWTPAQEENEEHKHQGHVFRNHRLPYWLNQIAEFGGPAAPLILAQTQVDKLSDRAEPHQAVQDIFNAFETKFEIQHSAQGTRGHEDLREALRECYVALTMPMIGKVRARVKKALAELAMSGIRTLPLSDFEALCNNEGGVADTARFLESLHNAGSVFYRPGFFADDIILNQKWAIEAIYSVFERSTSTYKSIQSMGGHFTRTMLAPIWEALYSPNEQQLFIDMMRSCGICFEYQSAIPSSGIEARYIAPDLLPECCAHSVWDGENADMHQFRSYSMLPGALIRSIISTVGDRAGIAGDYWRSGLRVYEQGSKSEALIVAQTDGAENGVSGRLRLSTRNGNARELLNTLVEIVEREENRLGLSPSQVEGDALDTEPRWSSEQSDAEPDFYKPERKDPEWFVSYANSDEDLHKGPVDQFCQRMQSQYGIEIRRDTRELKQSDVIKDFMRQLAKGDRIIVWLTDAYLKSPWCMWELHAIWEESERRNPLGHDSITDFENRVAVVLGDAKIRTEKDLLGILEHWDEEFKAVQCQLEIAEIIDEETRLANNAIVGFKKNTLAIVRFFRGRIQHQSFEAVKLED
ncbi:MAG: COR domain-containing protein, partial [Sulfitobacter sp.]